MGIFKKKGAVNPEIPSLPPLSKLPNFPEMDNRNPNDNSNFISQLPEFPPNTIGEKFSQESIKKAVSGEKEDDENFEMNESDFEEGEQMIPKLPQKQFPLMETLSNARPISRTKEYQEPEKNGPIFVRIDRFEEAVKSIKKIKEQLSSIEQDLEEVKKIKEKEEKEISLWEEELGIVKQQIEKIDKEIFSKVE